MTEMYLYKVSVSCRVHIDVWQSEYFKYQPGSLDKLSKVAVITFLHSFTSCGKMKIKICM